MYFKYIILENTLYCYQINSSEPPYFTTVTLVDSGLSIAEELIQQNFAKPGREPITADQHVPKPKALTRGQTYDVGISWMVNPREFYCQLGSEESELCALQEKLAQTYETSRLNDEMLKNAQPGDYCVAYFSGENSIFLLWGLGGYHTPPSTVTLWGWGGAHRNHFVRQSVVDTLSD